MWLSSYGPLTRLYEVSLLKGSYDDEMWYIHDSKRKSVVLSTDFVMAANSDMLGKSSMFFQDIFIMMAKKKKSVI